MYSPTGHGAQVARPQKLMYVPQPSGLGEAQCCSTESTPPPFCDTILSVLALRPLSLPPKYLMFLFFLDSLFCVCGVRSIRVSLFVVAQRAAARWLTANSSLLLVLIRAGCGPVTALRLVNPALEASR